MPRWSITLTLAMVVLVLVFVPALGGAYTPEVLKVSAIPDENPNELLRIYTPFAEHLAKQIGIKVQFVPVVDYAATVEGLAAKKLDLVWYGGFTSVQAVRRTEGKATRLVMRREDTEFKSVFVARRDSPIKTLVDLKGKTFAFGSVSSTSGHLMPRFFLLKNGIDPDRDFGQKPAFSGAHDATALWVESGKVDAGAVNFLVWDTDTLSGGQQQRVAIARVLVQDPDVILGDEPVSSVDPSLAASLVGLLSDLSEVSRKTLLMNLHSVDLALTFFPRIVGVRQGRVAFDLPPERVTAELLEALYAGALREDAPIPGYEHVPATSRVCRPAPGLR